MCTFMIRTKAFTPERRDTSALPSTTFSACGGTVKIWTDACFLSVAVAAAAKTGGIEHAPAVSVKEAVDRPRAALLETSSPLTVVSAMVRPFYAGATAWLAPDH